MANKQAVLNHKWTHLNEEEAAEAVSQGGIDPRVRFRKYKADGRFARSCPICWKICAQLSILKLHMRTHKMGLKGERKIETEDNVSTEPRFQCPYCDDVFKFRTRLREHVENLHTFENPLACAVCNQVFATALDVITHWKIHKTGGRSRRSRTGQWIQTKNTNWGASQRHCSSTALTDNM